MFQEHSFLIFFLHKRYAKMFFPSVKYSLQSFTSAKFLQKSGHCLHSCFSISIFLLFLSFWILHTTSIFWICFAIFILDYPYLQCVCADEGSALLTQNLFRYSNWMRSYDTPLLWLASAFCCLIHDFFWLCNIIVTYLWCWDHHH